MSRLGGGEGFIMANMGGGVVQDGHSEKGQESLKQVHYDYKKRLGV